MSRFSGRHHTEESKEKIRQASIGNKRALGYHHTEEARFKMGLAKKGRILTIETKARISQAKIGKPCSEETKAKLHRANLGKVLTEEQKAKLRQVNLGRSFTEEHRAKLRGKKSILTRYKMSQAAIGNKKTLGFHHTDEFKINLSRNLKRRWQNPAYKNKVLKASMLGRFIHPNKPELLLLELLENNYPGKWKFVGDGQLIVGGLNPDFANVNGQKQFIEMWGDYWHRGEDPQDRIDLFKQYGCNTLVIWDSELTEPNKVLIKIAEF